jgi:hypothetical protein
MSTFVDYEIAIECMLAEPRNAVLEMIARPEGATIGEIADAMNWECHSARGFISRHLNHDGIEVTSAWVGGQRRYRTAYSLEDMLAE